MVIPLLHIDPSFFSFQSLLLIARSSTEVPAKQDIYQWRDRFVNKDERTEKEKDRDDRLRMQEIMCSKRRCRKSFLRNLFRKGGGD